MIKTIYFCLVSLALLLWPTKDGADMRYSKRQVWTANGLSFESNFSSWDAEQYLFLSEGGYHAGLGQCAFYPLYPMLVRWVSAVTRSDDILVALVLANAFSTVGLILFFEIAAARFGEGEACLATALLLAFPGSLFFQFIYTEALFLLLLMVFCLGLEQGRWRFVVGAGFLLPLTRAVGIFCVFPLAWRVFFGAQPTRRRRSVSQTGLAGIGTRLVASDQTPWPVSAAFAGRIGSGRRGTQRNLERGELEVDVPQTPASDVAAQYINRRGWQWFLAVLAPFFGWGLYFFLMAKWTGDPFEGFAAQKQFGVESVSNLFHPVTFVVKLFSPTDWHGYTGSVLDRCMFVLLLYSLPLIWKLSKEWFIWSFFLGVVPAVSGGFTSYTRFLSVVFPFFIALSVFLSQPGRRWLRWVTLAVFAVLHVVLVWRFVNYRWAG